MKPSVPKQNQNGITDFPDIPPTKPFVAPGSDAGFRLSLSPVYLSPPYGGVGCLLFGPNRSGVRPCIRARSLAIIVIDGIKAPPIINTIETTILMIKCYICPDGNTGQLVRMKSGTPDGSNAVGDSNIGQLVVVKRAVPNRNNTVTDGNVGQLIGHKRLVPNVSNAVGDSNTGQLVVGKRPMLNADNAAGDGNASQLVVGKRTILDRDHTVRDGNADKLVRIKHITFN